MFIYVMWLMLLGGDMHSQKIGILVFDGVLTSEVTAPAEVFGMACQKDWFKDWQVQLIGVDNQAFVTTAEGLKLGVDVNLEHATDVAVLIVPGAHDMAVLNQNTSLLNYLKRHGKENRWLASNCSGAFLLGHAGVLNGFRATTWFGGEPSLAKEFAAIDVVTNQPVVLDRRRITSNGGLVSYDAAFVLLAKLSSVEHAHEVYRDLQAQRITPWADLVKMIRD